MRRILGLLFVLITFLLGMPVLAQDDTIPDELERFAERSSEGYDRIIALIDATPLADVFADDMTEVTFFAPTDDAIEILLDELGISADDLLNNPDVLLTILNNHAVKGSITSADLIDDTELETLDGEGITVTVTDDGDVQLNEEALIITPSIEASNGVVYGIDAVLLPDADLTLTGSGGGVCIVSAEGANTARVRVGPGNNRTSVTFLPTGTEFEVLGQTDDDEGNTWYQLDKEEAAPGRAINEAWIAAADVNSSGDCDNIGEAAAPPLIPIAPVPPPQTSGETAGGEQPEAPAQQTGARPNAGTWTVTLNPTTNLSCAGTGNVALPTTELFLTTSIPVSASYSGSTFIFDGVAMNQIGDGVYNGATNFEGFTGTFYIDSVINPNQMVGRFIGSEQDCSFTVTFVANR